MVLYHGTVEDSAIDIKNNGVKLFNSIKPLDFGSGFYTTPDYVSAERWAKRKAISWKGKPSVVSVYVDELKMKPFLVKFEDDLRWGQFVINNRNGMSYIDKISSKEHNLDAKYDIVYGRIADLNVYNIAKALKESYKELDNIGLILNLDYSFQYSFHTQDAIDCIQKVTYRNL